MAWSSIRGHDGVIERFRQSLETGRMSHAYLFVGPPGIGKELFTRELAKALLCAQDTGEACGLCPACHKVEHGNHPDVTFVRRIERTSKGARKTQIVIDQMREEIQEPIAYKPFEGRFKVFVVAEAERMTEEAQNCLLKTLEEPPPHSLLILLAARLEPFVDTVVSRCQIVRFRPLPPALVEEILIDGHQMEPERARLLARLSEGSPGQALRHEAQGTHETAVWLLDSLRSMRGQGAEFIVASELYDRARDQGSTLEDTRDHLRPLLDLLALAWRDVLFRASGFADEMLTWGTDCQALEALASTLSAARARRLTELFAEARDHLDANANIKLLLENLLLNVGALLHGGAPIGAR